jgi:uncharacterized protein YehS (DUF1456 family)
LGKALSLNNCNNIKPIKSSSKVLDVTKLDNKYYNKNDKNDNENGFEGFLNRDQSKSYIGSNNTKKGKRGSLPIDKNDDDKSDNIIKKRKKNEYQKYIFE